MRINKFIANFILAAAPLAASHMVYLKDTATGLGAKQAVTADSQGNAYVAGTVGTGATGTSLIGPRGGLSDVKVVKLNQTGQVVWTTIIGGTGTDKATAITLAPNGQIFLAIDSDSTDFPLAASNSGKGVVAVLNASGTALSFATRLAGAGAPLRIFVDSQLNSYIGGNTLNGDFVQVGAVLQPTPSAPDPYVAKLSATGAVILARVILTNAMTDFAAGPAGFWAVVGSGFLTFVDSFGGGGGSIFNQGDVSRITVDNLGAAYTVGMGGTPRVQRWVSSSLGPVYDIQPPVPITGPGAGIDDIAVNAAGEVHFTLRTTSPNVTPVNPLPGVGSSSTDNVLVKLNAAGTGTLLLSTYVGLALGSQTSSLFVNPTGIYFTVGATQATRIMESAADFRVLGINRFKNGNVSNIVVRVRNNGPESSSAQFSAQVPGTPQGASVAGGQGNCSLSGSNLVTCGFPFIVSGGFADVTIGTIPPASGSLEASPTVFGTKPDPNPANDTISFTFQP